MSNVDLPFSRPTLSPEAIQEVVECLQSGWITTGPRVARFEQDLRNYLGAPYALTLASATAGLHAALLALDLQPGDEVITTPLTFVATANTIVLAGGTPVFADIDPGTRNIDTGAIEAAITPRTRAMVPVHFAGLPVDLDAVYALAERHGLRVIEDAAHAIGTEYRGRRIGSFGDTQVFSFHPNKNMTTGEGGAVTTRDDALARRVELMRFHGIDRQGAREPEYDVALAGLKSNMMDLQAALGIHQLRALDGFIQRRTELARLYLERLVGHPWVSVPASTEWPHRHAWHLFTVLLGPNPAGLDRSGFIDAMRAEGIGIGLHYQAIHMHRLYRERFGYAAGRFPHAEAAGRTIISLPLFPAMRDADVDRVVTAMERVLGGRPA